MKKLVYVCLILLVSSLPAVAADAGTFTSVRASKDVALETNPKSAFWQGSDPIFIVNDNWGKPVARLQDGSVLALDQGQFVSAVCVSVREVTPEAEP